ncbi:MAG: hypothetical protein ACOC44_03885 [Promethearchaeia archaeon]
MIKKIHFAFTHNKKDYILFSTERPSRMFLYFQHKLKDLRALFYGRNFQRVISRLLEQRVIPCIECKLGTNIEGGISLDSGKLVENNLSLKKANEILTKLRENQTERFEIKLF